MTLLTQPCPAKLNLFLEVRGKRADGFHDLGTLFQALDFGDTLSAEPSDVIEVYSDLEIPGPPESNLVYKAAMLLQKRFNVSAGIRFSLTKRIPTGAGLGGGSSDAATALRLCSELWALGLSNETLRNLAADLGSDVPFFLFSDTAFAEGRGEVLSAAPTPFPFHVVVATPSVHVETAWAYRELQGKPFGTQWEEFKAQYGSHSQEPTFYAALHNDFEAPIAAHFAEIRQVRDILNGFQPVKTLLTGSGASLFSLFLEESRAHECLAKAAPLCRFSALTRFKTAGLF